MSRHVAIDRRGRSLLPGDRAIYYGADRRYRVKILDVTGPDLLAISDGYKLVQQNVPSSLVERAEVGDEVTR